MLAIVALLAMAAAPVHPGAAAEADRLAYPASEWGYVYYLSTAHLEGELRGKTETALRFRVAGTSQQQIAEKCQPVEVAEGLWRLDLRELKWDWRQWHIVAKRHPYQAEPGTVALVLRADWLLLQITDTTESDAYYRLLYGTEKLTRDEYLKAWQVSADVDYRFSVVTRSNQPDGPAVSGIRHIENRPTATRSSAWGTRDSAKITPASDPLEHPAGDFKHDAEEWLAPMPKISSKKKETGILLAAFLSDAKGNRQEEAPPKIVTDHKGFRGQAAIRNNGSCWGCHAAGIRDPQIDEFRFYIARGVEPYAAPKAAAENIERYLLTPAAKEVKRNNEDYAAAVRMVTGQECDTVAEAFTGALAAYDAPVTLDAAARELYTTPAELTLALAAAQNVGHRFGARLSGLAHGLDMPRSTWEELYPIAWQYVRQWEKQK